MSEDAYQKLNSETLRAAAAEVYKQAGHATVRGEYADALALQERAKLFERNAALRD